MDTRLNHSTLLVREVGHRYGNEAPFLFQGLSFKVCSGEVVGIIGGNGSGKTTLLNICSLLLRPTTGEVSLLGSSTGGDLGTWLARSFQHPPDVEGVPVWRYLTPIPAIGARGKRGSWPWLLRCLLEDPLRDLLRSTRGQDALDLQDAESLLRTTHIPPDLALRPFDTLSLGARRIVDVVRALRQGTELFILDEPFANVASHGVDGIIDLICSARKAGAAGLITDHNTAALSRCADRCLRLTGESLTEI